MTVVVPILRDDERLEAACRWVVRLDEGLSREDEAALKDWLAERPGNAAELVAVARAWDKLDCLSRLADVFPIEPSLARAVPSNQPRRRPAATWLAAAACVLVALATAWLLAPQRHPVAPDPDRRAAWPAGTYETAIGEHRTVTLADGSAVTLNTDSRISVAYSASGRLLELFRGEIHIQVAPDPARPFSVIAGDRVVQAVGTAFTVELTAGRELELVVTEGKVTVGVRRLHDGAAPAQLPVDAAFVEPASAKTVSAGQELIVRAAEEVIVPVSPEDIEVRLAWRDGRLIFRDEPLERAIAEIERYTTVDFVFLDEELRQQSISGRYKAGDVESLLLALSANFGIRYEYDGPDRVLLRSL